MPRSRAECADLHVLVCIGGYTGRLEARDLSARSDIRQLQWKETEQDTDYVFGLNSRIEFRFRHR